MPVQLQQGQAKICCDSIGEQDGGMARFLIDREINRAINDLEDRAEHDGKPRKVVIEVELMVKEGLIIADVSATAKLPAYRSRKTVCKLRMESKGQHALIFQTANPENPDQPTFGDVSEQDADE